ncbi:MFS transporter [Sporolactobacillus sp. STSJ-5]|uniref:MFS transporter n=1 Tax=Sporolactobacillus sp. STSJ-5 TaxID=2965076 RepID=UPI0021076FF4|nr:MFS transporter [Sporolactobacillus sp. STSJ-5]MCQ2009912.1 MFS transporter [Sporolactobacillus sp. STSJ-5]
MVGKEEKSAPLTHSHWRRLMLILLFGNMVAGIAFSEVMPFLPFFLRDLGNFSTHQLNSFSALVFSSTYFTALFLSPVWGKLGDRFGRKPILLLSAMGAALTIGAFTMVTNVWAFIGLRLLQGAFAGYFSNTNALLAAEVPKEKGGYALGTLAIGFITGSLLGPLIGGVIGSLVGYRLTFLLASFLLIGVFFINLFGVDETNRRPWRKRSSLQHVRFNDFPKKKIIVNLYLTALLIQIGNNSISPIQPLYVAQLMNNTGNVNLMNGLVASAPGVSCLLMSSYFGKLGDRIGTERILKVSLLASICFLLPMAFVTNIWQLVILQLLIGLSDSALMPAVSILLAKNTPVSISSSIFGYNQSFQSAGIVIGPFLGSYTANLFGYRGVFLMAVLIFCALVVVNKSTRYQ